MPALTAPAAAAALTTTPAAGASTAITTAPAASTIVAAITTVSTSAAAALTTATATPTAAAAFLATATTATQTAKRVRNPNTKPPATVEAKRKAMRPGAAGAGKAKRKVGYKGTGSGGVGGRDGATQKAKRVCGPRARPAEAILVERMAATPPGATETGMGDDNVSGKGTGSGGGGGGGGDGGQRKERVWNEQELKCMTSGVWGLLDDPEFLTFVEEVKEAAEGLT